MLHVNQEIEKRLENDDPDPYLDSEKWKAVYEGPLTMEVAFLVPSLQRYLHLVLNFRRDANNQLTLRDPINDKPMYTLEQLDAAARKKAFNDDHDLAVLNLSDEKLMRTQSFKPVGQFGKVSRKRDAHRFNLGDSLHEELREKQADRGELC